MDDVERPGTLFGASRDAEKKKVDTRIGTRFSLKSQKKTFI